MRRRFEAHPHTIRRLIASVVFVVSLGLSSSAREAHAQQPPMVAPWDLPAAPAVCAPGSVSRCACAGGATGVRRCLGVGTAFSRCQCNAVRPQSPGEVESPSDRDPSTRERDGARSGRQWYGWQFLIVDGVSLVLAVSTIGTGSLAQIGVAYTGFALGAPIVHWSHGNVGRGFGSLGLRVGLPAVALGIAVLSGRGYASLLIGAVLVPTAVAAAITIDATALAYESAPNARERRGLAWAPTLDLRADGATLGVAGSF